MERIDLTGMRFSRWQVLSYAKTSKGNAHWLCRCDCGEERLVNGLSLRDGRSTSCGCRRDGLLRSKLVGIRFGFLVVVADAGSKKTSAGNRSHWLCRCDCGKEKIVLGSTLLYGKTKSCGRCALISHGESYGAHETTEYRTWGQMWSRCNNPHHDSWKDYGGRGIVVCGRWRSYETFLADMGRKPTAAHSIDRIDVDGNYEPGNCRWVTKKEQTGNRRPLKKVGRIERFTDAELIAELRRRGHALDL